MKRPPGKPRDIGTILAETLKTSNLSTILDFAVITTKWPEIVGDKLARVSEPSKLKNKVLSISVTEPVWVDSMMYMRSVIVSKINSLFHNRVVDNVRVSHKTGLVPSPGTEAGDDERINIPDAGGVDDMTCEDINLPGANLSFDNLDDSQLRSTFKRVILKDIVAKSRRSRNP